MNGGHDTLVIADGDKTFSSPYVFNKIATSRGPTQKRGTRVSTVKQYSSTDTARCALGWHVMALHCTPRTRTIRIAHAHFSDSISDPWGKSDIQTRKIPHPAPGGGRWGLTLIGAFVLCACPPTHICQAATYFDHTLREALESIVGGPLSDWSWLKISLPSSLGGLNLRSASLHAPAAFLAACSSSQSLVEGLLGHPPSLSPHTSPAVSALATAAARPEWQCLDDIDVPLRQRVLSHSIDEASFQHLLSSAPSTRPRAVILSSALPHAGDWLNVVPTPSLGLNLQDSEFRFCLRYWLRVPMHSNPFPCPECRGTADTMGDHQVGCGGNGDRIFRHNAIRDVLFTAAQSAALAPSKETPGLVPSSLSRPADVLLPNWCQGLPNWCQGLL